MLSVIEGKGTTIHSGVQFYVWDTVQRCYVNAQGQRRSGHAADIAFDTREAAEDVVNAHSTRAEIEDWEPSR